MNANLTLDVLLVPALQTPYQPGWPQTNQWHTCRFILPPSDSYVVVNHQHHQASTLPKKYCQVQLQFVTLKDQHLQEFNLTEPFCLHGSTDHIVKGNPLKWLKLTYLNLTWMECLNIILLYSEILLKLHNLNRLNGQWYICTTALHTNTQCKYILSANLSAIPEKTIACEFLECIIAKLTGSISRFYFSLNGINYLQTKMKRKAN